MLLRCSAWVQKGLFLLSIGWEVWTTKVRSPIYSNQKDVQAVKQLISRGQLPLDVKLTVIWMLPCLEEEYY